MISFSEAKVTLFPLVFRFVVLIDRMLLTLSSTSFWCTSTSFFRCWGFGFFRMDFTPPLPPRVWDRFELKGIED